VVSLPLDAAAVRIDSPRRIGPEKGVIHLAVGAVDNALWDMFARSRAKPLWKLIVDMSPVSPPIDLLTYSAIYATSLSLSLAQETLVRSATWRYLSDALTKEEAVSLLKAKEPGKSVREAIVKESGFASRPTLQKLQSC
jgi:L-fuconate dehydratase